MGAASQPGNAEPRAACRDAIATSTIRLPAIRGTTTAPIGARSSVQRRPNAVEVEGGVMDERRFDTWTRAVAQSGSRRRLVRALLGGGAVLAAARRGLSDAAAHHGIAGPGDACRTDSQCVAADAPMVCAWNGYGNGLSCCTYEGSNCADDSWCCGSNLCSGGTCSSQSYGCTGEGCD